MRLIVFLFALLSGLCAGEVARPVSSSASVSSHSVLRAATTIISTVRPIDVVKRAANIWLVPHDLNSAACEAEVNPACTFAELQTRTVETGDRMRA